MEPLKIAVEYERGLYDQNRFTIRNVAHRFLKHRLNKDRRGESYFCEEGTRHQNEFNSIPSHSLDQLCLNFLEAEDASDAICHHLGVVNIPINENGSGRGWLNPKVSHRIIGYETIFGKEMVKKLIKITGIHFHIDQHKRRIVDQFNALTALRPSIAFTSTSPISYQRKNNANCHRYLVFADPVEGIFAKIPEEQGYITSLQDLIKRDEERHRKWKERFEAGARQKNDLPRNYQFWRHFPRERTGYPDIRYRPDMGKGTLEIRRYDTAPLNVVLAQAGLVLGYINRILDKDIPIEIAEKDGLYGFDHGKVLLPNEETLNHLTTLAAQEGLENSQVKKYNGAVNEFARKGIASSEQHYLNPLQEMLESGKNVASQILDHLGHKEQYTLQESARANKFVWEKHQQAVKHLEEKTGYERRFVPCAA